VTQVRQFYEEWLSYDALRYDTGGVRRPYLLRIWYTCALLGTVMFPAFLIFAPLNLGEYTINDREMSGREFVQEGGLMYLLLFFLVSVVVARGLHFKRTWIRPLLALGFNLLLLLALVLNSSLVDASSVVNAFLIDAALLWYLYRKDSVVQYFASTPAANGQQE
jgi:hypothetical protein